MRATLLPGVIGFVLSGFCAADALALTYTEGMDGELSDSSASPTPLLVTTGGTSTVSGLISYDYDGTLKTDSDWFSISLPTGGVITSVRVDISNVNLGSFELISAASRDGYGLAKNFEFLIGGVTSASSFTAGDLVAFPVLMGISVTGAGFDDTISPFISGSFEYTYTITTDIAPVPVPATLPLLLGALGGFGVLARRRRRQEH